MDNTHHPDQISHPPSSHTEHIRPSSALYRYPPLGSHFLDHTQPHCSPQSVLHPQHPSMQFDNTPYAQDSCITPLLPPGVDPASVDFRTFYPYIPNEVKHRKRTSRTQLKVLEDIFRRDTKPNAQLRKKLAKQLDMTARGVQVWFQNRRAKEKTQARKALSASKTAPIPNLGRDTQSIDLITPKPDPSAENDPPSSSPGSEHSSEDKNTPDAMEPSSSTSSRSPSQFSLDSAGGSWQVPHNAGSPSGFPHSISPESHLHGLRRGSLPLISVTSDRSMHGPQLDHLDPLSRRRSVDTSLHRLASHPYAQLAMAKNGALYGHSLSRYPSQLRLSTQVHNHARPNLAPRASLPQEFSTLSPRQRASLDTRGYHFSALSASPPSSSSSSPLSVHPPNTGFDNRHYSIPARTISSPIPGPLPRADFSFGAPSLTPPTTSPSPVGVHCDSPDSMPTLPNYTQARPDDPDTEDDGTSASYDAFSRFGSIASLTGSESSSTSAYYSDVGSTGVSPDMRRGSCSGQILDLLSGLDVNGEHGTSPITQGAYSPHEELNVAGLNTCEGDGQSGDSTYPSPSSTVSPDHSNHEPSPPAIPISRSSELAFALQNNQEQVAEGGNDPHRHYHGQPASPVADTNGSSQNGAQYMYGHNPGSFPVQSASTSSSGSSQSLPMMEFAEKFRYEGDLNAYSPTGHYTDVPPYPSPGEGHFTADASFSPGDGRNLNHGTDFGSPSDVYNGYPPPNVLAPHHPLDSFVQYS
jgi:hypothetical protein